MADSDPSRTGPSEGGARARIHRRDPDTSPGMRLGFVAGVIVLGMLLAASASTPSAASEPRFGARGELLTLIRDEQRQNELLAERVEELKAEVAAAERSVAIGADLGTARQAVDDRLAEAGMTALEGPGLTVTLDDATIAQREGTNVNDYVIHEQDLQAVINALWAGGSEGIAVNGQRIGATTAIRCVGNVLLLHGMTYSPPYVIEAVGDADDLVHRLQRDEAVARFADAVDSFKLEFDAAESSELHLPAYDGPSIAGHAQPLEGAANIRDPSRRERRPGRTPRVVPGTRRVGEHEADKECAHG